MDNQQLSEQEEDNLKSSNNMNKQGEVGDGSISQTESARATSPRSMETQSCNDNVKVALNKDLMDEALADEHGEVSNDDLLDKDSNGPWFSIGMSRSEKIEARRPWRMSIIIKLIGLKIS